MHAKPDLRVFLKWMIADSGSVITDVITLGETMADMIRVTCVKCNARYAIDADHGGRMGRCSQCDERFILPIPCPDQLLEWANSTTWKRLTRFVTLSGARGHDRPTIDRLIEVFTQRRWAEEHKTYRETSETGRSLTRREKIWQKAERRIQFKSILEEILSFTPYEFEQLVADVFSSKGLTARAVGGGGDDGIDVKIWGENGEFWAIAQCKRYATDNRIGASQIREFAGAFLLSNAKKGFFFTTSSFTRHAKKTARGYPWLTIYDGQDFVRYIEKLKFEIEHHPKSIA